MSMKKKEKQYKAVFRTRIDFKHDELNRNYLLPGGTYHLLKNSDERTSYADIANEAVRIINNSLKAELQKYPIILIEEVQVQAVYEGSIEIIYSVVLSFLEFVGGLKDLYDAVRLIREISERHINKKLNDKFGRHFEVNTYVIVPEKGYWRIEDEMVNEQVLNGRVAKRDSFFYYLLVANILLLVVIGIFVFPAVRTVYFGG